MSRIHVGPISGFLLILATLATFPLAAAATAGEAGSGPGASSAPRGVVWLTCTVSGKENATIKVPLEWLAEVDQKEHNDIRIEDVHIDAVALWEEYKDLAPGERREVRRGVDKEGQPYVLQVVSQPPARDRAQGRVHIVNRDKHGKITDVAFPLDIPKLIESLANVFAQFFGGEGSEVKIADLSIPGPGDLKKLADYGRFVFLESVEADSSRVRISVD